MKDAADRTDDDIEAILDFLLHFPVKKLFSSKNNPYEFFYFSIGFC